ncbi:hypothetical protein VNO78_21117 [Psophocarpus tetragonolobus]|uniref:Late embryogenesis abundant protein LEA-2 subgroup domain-containing protein n=1 Tax=Psophocarpus tetragonolobus TaxID=3891 RepID=A0AAN9SEM4_PSOTE
MADTQPQLNDAVASNERERLHTRCCYCLFKTVWIILVLIIILVMVVILVLYIVIQPRSFKFHVTEATLSQFNYTANDNTLRYNLVLNFTARNPNKKLNFYYDQVVAHVSYDGVTFASADVITWMTSFRQYEKNTDPMSGVFSGHHVMALDINDFEQDKRSGVFHIDVSLNFETRYRLGNFIFGDTKPRVHCGLQVPFGSNGLTLIAFRPTQCLVDF